MSARSRPWWPWLAVALLCGGCARGCEGRDGAARQNRLVPPPAPTSAVELPQASTPARAARPTSLPDQIERELAVALPRRGTDNTFTGLATYPRRGHARFDTDKHLIAAVDAGGLRVLDLALQGDAAQDDARFERTLAEAAERWERRAGVAATRLYLAVDRGTSPVEASRVRRLALRARGWRVVALARQGEQLLELLLSPAAAQRPTGVP